MLLYLNEFSSKLSLNLMNCEVQYEYFKKKPYKFIGNFIFTYMYVG